MIKKYLLPLTLVFILALSLSSCGALVKAKARKNATVEKGAIPANFGEGNTAILFRTTGKKSYDKYLKRNIRMVYKGNYELASNADIKSGKYDDISKYRYIFDYEGVSYSYRSNNTVIYGPGGGTGTGTVRRFAITDRKDDKMYVMPMTSGLWGKLQRMYLMNMEAVRSQNNGGSSMISK